MVILMVSRGVPSENSKMNGLFEMDQARALAREGHTVILAALDLRSASFAISYDSAEDLFTIHTQGYGHGVGLSQYGADYMARQGADFKEILTHYYTGVELAVLD